MHMRRAVNRFELKSPPFRANLRAFTETRNTGVWERAVSSYPHKNLKWRTRKLFGEGPPGVKRTTQIAKYTPNLS